MGIIITFFAGLYIFLSLMSLFNGHVLLCNYGDQGKILPYMEVKFFL